MRFFISICFFLSTILLSLVVTAQEASQLKHANSAQSELEQFIRMYTEDEAALYRTYRIPSSPERIARLNSFYEGYKKDLEAYPFKELSINGQVDYVLLERLINNELFLLDKQEKGYEAQYKWIKAGEPLYQIEKDRRRGKRLDAKATAIQLHDIQQEISKLKSELKKADKTFTSAEVKQIKGILNGQQKALRSVYKFYNAYDPDFSWWVTKPHEALDSLYSSYGKLFNKRVDPSTKQKDDGSGIIGQPLGREELIRRLQLQYIPYSPEELVKIAEKEFAWCDAEIKKATEEMGFGKDRKAALEAVKESHVPVGDQPELMTQLYNESVDFLKEKDLLSIPPLAEETWRMTMLSAKAQKVSPFFLGGEVLYISYPTDGMAHDLKMMSMRGNNPHFSRAVIHHELIAGHHLQQFMTRRYKTYRNQLIHTPFWTEGWALYWEMLLYDQGFPQSPEDRMGMLFWRSHRCARIIFSINYHLGKWTPQECIDFIVDRVGHERANAEAEIRRSFEGNYGPLYQIAYMIGGLQIYDMKRELVDNGDISLKAFHDAILRENVLPIELLRAILKQEGLSPEYKSKWKFYPSLK